MDAPQLLLDGLFALAIAAVYAYIGRVLGRRKVAGEARKAAVLFSVWWYALAALTATGAAVRGLAWAHALTFPLMEAQTYATLPIFCLALAALVYYLLYLLTGRAGLLAPIATGYAVLYVLLVFYVAWSEPTGFEAKGWTVRLTYAHEPGGWPVTLAVLAMLLPPIVGAIGYFRLFFQVRDRTQRYRIGLVAGAIFSWFGSALLASEIGISGTDWWALAGRVIGLVAALVILMAYVPPAWLRRRLGIESVREEPASRAA